jgi:hypothetical protein
MAEFTVHAPVDDYSGEVCGVQFKDGTAVMSSEDNPAALGYFASAGYKVEKKTARSSSKTATKE